MNCQSLEDCVLFKFERKTYLSALKNNPDTAFSIMDDMCTHTRQYLLNIADLSLSNGRTRLADYLSHLAHISSTNSQISVPLCRKELSSLLCISRETLSRILTAMSQEKTIEVNGDFIKILDREKLSDYPLIEAA